MDALGDALVALATKLQPDGIELIVGGGYGLVLRAHQLAAARRTGRYGVPLMSRSTADIDCFLSTEIITDGAKTERIAVALNELGFTPRVQYFIFERTVEIAGHPQTIEIDLLASDVGPEHEDLVHRSDDRRIRPNTFGHLHARRTPEAVTVERAGSRVNVGTAEREVFVIVPHPVSFVVMKLFAFRDRIEHEDPEMQRDAPYHAFDVFSALASMNAEEWDQAVTILGEPRASAIVDQARGIIQRYFNDLYALGVIRLVEYADATTGLRIPEEGARLFVRDLADLFSPSRENLRGDLTVLATPR